MIDSISSIRHMSEEKKDGQPTLTAFIDENHKLISSAGIFATISILVNRLPAEQFGPFGKILSFGLFALVIIICLEIYGNFPWTEKGKVYWFREFFGFVMFGFGYLWVWTFYPFLLIGLLIAVLMAFMTLIFVGCVEGIRRLVLKISWFKKLNQRMRERIIPLVGTMVIFVAALVILHHFRLIR